MRTEGLLAAFGGELVWVVLATGLSVLVAAVLGVALLQRRALPGAALPAGAALAAVSVWALAFVATLGWSGMDPVALEMAASTHSAVHLLGLMSMGPVVAVTWLVAAVVGARSRPWNRGHAATGLVLVLATAAVTVAGGFVEDNRIYATIRGLIYLVGGLGVVVALLGGGSVEEGGPDAGAGAAMAFPLLVAVGEASERGLAQLLLIQQAANVPAEKWDAAVAWMLDQVAGELWWAMVSLGLATAVAAVGASLGSRGRSSPWAIAGFLGWSALAWGVLWTADLGPARLASLRVLCGG